MDRRPGELHLEFFEHFHRFVILRSAATKDLRLLFGLFPARRRRFDMVASSTFTAQQGKNNRRSFSSLRMTNVHAKGIEMRLPWDRRPGSIVQRRKPL